MKIKTCRTCGKEKFLEEFYDDKQNSDGKRSTCEECGVKATMRWKSKNPTKERKINQEAGKWNHVMMRRLCGYGF